MTPTADPLLRPLLALAFLCSLVAVPAAPASAQAPAEPAPEGAAATAASARQDAPGVLTVGTKVAPPFAMRHEDGSWYGIAIDLWDEIAGDLGYRYELVELPLERLIEGLEDGTLDASVAALTVTSDREALVDFSHGFYDSGLAIAVPGGRGLRASAWVRGLRSLLDPAFLTAIGSLAVVLFVAGLLVWFFERRHNPEQFEQGARGLASAFWWSAVTMTTVGYGDKAPVSAGGRIVALVWMFVSVIIISSFTAAITSSLTVAHFDSGIQGPDDLTQVVTATVAGSTSAQYLETHGLDRRDTTTVEEALELLAGGEVGAVVYDEPILRYLARSRSDVTVVPGTFERQIYALAFPQESPLWEPVDRALLDATRGSFWNGVLETYLGKEGKR